MTPRMKTFLLELASLMEKHGVSEMEATESRSSWEGSMAEGIEFTLEVKGEEYSMETYELGRWATPGTIRETVEGEE